LKGIDLIPTLLQGRRNWENLAKMEFFRLYYIGLIPIFFGEREIGIKKSLEVELFFANLFYKFRIKKIIISNTKNLKPFIAKLHF
jgi:hypothetical protein